MTLVAAVAAGSLVWFAPHFHRWTTGGYWGVIGLLTLAGVLVGVSQLHGRDGNPPGSFLVVFVPVFVAAAWVILAVQPQRDWVRNHILSWSGDIGIAHAVHNLGEHVAVLAFGLGIVFGVTFEPSMVRRGSKQAHVPVTLGVGVSGVGSVAPSAARAGPTIVEPLAERQQTDAAATVELDPSTVPPVPGHAAADEPTVVEPPTREQQAGAWSTTEADVSSVPSVSDTRAEEEPTVVESAAQKQQADAAPAVEVDQSSPGSVLADPAEHEPTTVKPPTQRDTAGS